MINDLVPLPATAAAGLLQNRAQPRPPAAAGLDAGAGVAEPIGARPHRTIAAPQELDRATRAAARAIFADREVEVTSFHDQASGRIVCTVADRRSGEVLLQTPPEALLRFFASTRAMLAAPLVAVDA